jgi:hypothetical protein
MEHWLQCALTLPITFKRYSGLACSPILVQFSELYHHRLFPVHRGPQTLSYEPMRLHTFHLRYKPSNGRLDLPALPKYGENDQHA